MAKVENCSEQIWSQSPEVDLVSIAEAALDHVVAITSTEHASAIHFHASQMSGYSFPYSMQNANLGIPDIPCLHARHSALYISQHAGPSSI